MDNLIPKISLTNLLSNDSDSLDLLSNALKNHGFFVITDHNIPHDLFHRSYEFSEKFFNLDLRSKINIPLEKMQALGVIHLLVKKLLWVKPYQI